MTKILVFRLFIALTGVLMALAANSQPLTPIAEELQQLADVASDLQQNGLAAYIKIDRDAAGRAVSAALGHHPARLRAWLISAEPGGQ